MEENKGGHNILLLSQIGYGVCHRGKLGNGERVQYLVEGVKVIKYFHPSMVTPMGRVNTN